MSIIKNKLDKFIRKYYSNKIAKGFIILIGIFLAILLLTSAIENTSWLSGKWRAIIFWFTIILSVVIFIIFILIPFLKLLNIGKTLSYKQAAKIVGKHFPEVHDKLLNYLQLEEMQGKSNINDDLILESLNQKTEKLHPINFIKAIDFSVTKKIFFYVLPILIIFLLIISFKPKLITKPTERIINYDKTYERPQDYYFNLIDYNNLNVVQNSDYTIKFLLSGDKFPNNVSLKFKGNGNNFNDAYMVKINDSTFQYTFKRVNEDITFYAYTENVKSDTCTIKMLPKPVIINFELILDFPNYTGLETKTIENSGIISVIYGTKGTLKLKTKDTKGIILTNKFNDTIKVDTLLDKSNMGSYVYTTYFYENSEIAVNFYNQHITNYDTLKYFINIINDLTPSIEVEEVKDTIYYKNIYFKGTISDDYGFSSLKFYYKVFDKISNNNSFNSIDIPIDKKLIIQDFYWTLNLDEINLTSGSNLEYYFEVCDNDAIKGYKCNKTNNIVYKKLTEEELDAISEETRESFKSDVNEAITKFPEINKDIEDLLKDLKEKESLTFQDKEKIEDLLKKQEEMLENLENQINKLNNDNFLQNENNSFNENILKKQEKINELFDKILNEDMKKMIEELQKMLEEFYKDNIEQKLQQLQFDSNKVQEQLDNTYELLKQLEFEQQFNKAISKLDSLAQDQAKLKEETLNAQKDSLSTHIKEKQEDINKKFDNVKEQLKKANELNEKLENKMNMDFEKFLQEEISNDLNDAKDNLEKMNKSGASKSQESAKEKMDQLSESLQMQFDKNFGEQQGEDIENMRRLLNNILLLSFKQENYIDTHHSIKQNDPSYINVIQKQSEINQQITIVEDSLKAIARRNFNVSFSIFSELENLNNKTSSVAKNLMDRKIYNAAKDMQYSMKSLNDLALLIDNSIDMMEEEDSGMCNSSCKNGKGKKKEMNPRGKPSMQTLQGLQEQLNQQMQQLKDMKDGKTGKDGKQGGEQKISSEQFARMAAQQEAIRRQLEELQRELRSSGEALDGSLQDIIQKMEKTEQQLINKQLSEQLMQRQQDILTRMLESEKSMKEREKDNKRTSKQGQNIKRPSPEEIFNKNEDSKHKSDDILKTIPPNLNNYYKQKINKYLYNLQESSNAKN
ncbi:MAG: hypothetical protein ACOX4D_00980 [Bacteroidales bacterium]